MSFSVLFWVRPIARGIRGSVEGGSASTGCRRPTDVVRSPFSSRSECHLECHRMGVSRAIPRHSQPLPTFGVRPMLGNCDGFDGDPGGIRTRDLDLERGRSVLVLSMIWTLNPTKECHNPPLLARRSPTPLPSF